MVNNITRLGTGQDEDSQHTAHTSLAFVPNEVAASPKNDREQLASLLISEVADDIVYDGCGFRSEDLIYHSRPKAAAVDLGLP